MHSSVEDVGAAAARVGADPIGSVGSATSVGLGSAVGLGSGVGGMGVGVGTAACVSATIVLAAATAEAWICAGSAVGAAGAQAAVTSRAIPAMAIRSSLIDDSPVCSAGPLRTRAAGTAATATEACLE